MTARDLLRSEGLKYKAFTFEGHCQGTSDTFPKEVGEYSTVRYGVLSEFRAGATTVGDWIMVFKEVTLGNADSPGLEQSLYVQEADVLAALEALRAGGKKVVEVTIPSIEERKEELINIINSKLEGLSLASLVKMIEME